MGDMADYHSSLIFDDEEQSNELEEYTVEYIHETSKGLLINDGEKEIWLPISQIQGFERCKHSKGTPILILVPEWLAKDKEMI